MKKGIFSFSTVFTFSLVLIFLASCSNSSKTETETTANSNETEVSEELISNAAETETTEIDYSDLEKDQTKEQSLTTKDIKTDKNDKKVTPKKTTIKNSNNKTTEADPNKPKTSPVKTSPKKPKTSTVEADPNKKPKTSTVEADPNRNNKQTKPVAQAFSHAIWNRLLIKYVSPAGKVNYSGFKRNQAALKSYLDLLSKNEPSGKSRNDQIAFWINAYNAHTVDLIVKNYPVSSILKLDNGKTWSVKRITIGGKKYSLEDIEKKILIGKYNEPRIHFAINCAAKSCPPLKNSAWEGRSLNSNLDRASKDFINNSAYNTIEKKSANLSQIFNWYKGDFSDVNAFINKYANTKITGKTKISYSEYNWNLNK